jgi:outer membrane lipoprotein carrier protein
MMLKTPWHSLYRLRISLGALTMFSRIFCFLLLLLILLPSASFAGASSFPALEGLEMLRKAFVGVNDFTAEITQEKQLSLMKRKMVASGEVRFKKPDSFYLELYSPYASRVLLKDNSLTLKLPNEGIRQKMTLPREQGLGRWFEFLDHPVKSLPEGFDIRAERRGGTIILSIFPCKKGAMKELQLLFQQGGELKRLVIEENNRDKTVITFSNMKKNTGLSEKDFHLD